MTRSKWTEKKITAMLKEGRGSGSLADYMPWIRVEEVSSLGRMRRVWSAKTGRYCHLLSDVEFRLFLALEWQLHIIDIREQYPLDRNLTQDIARSLGIRHPHYPGTNIPAVMTVDFLVTQVVGGENVLVAYNAKRDEEAEEETSILKLEIQRTYFEQIGLAHHAVYHSQIPEANVANIGDIREATLKPNEVEPRPGYFASLTARMAMEIGSADPKISLRDYCNQFDSRFGASTGVGIRVARMLMHERILIPNLAAFDLTAEPLSAFLVKSQRPQLRAVGGM